VKKKIIDIDPSKDVRVRIFGNVIDKKEGAIVVDDGSMKAEIVLDESLNIKIGSFVRVFTRILPLEKGYELRAEIVQNMENVDPILYKKVKNVD